MAEANAGMADDQEDEKQNSDDQGVNGLPPFLHDDLESQCPDDVKSTDPDSISWVDSAPDCPVCLQVCLHPVELPCAHIFCFLCVKGVAARGRRCALCRREIPFEYFDNPKVVKVKANGSQGDGEDRYKWYYEGRNGWWQYDERASAQLEETFQKEKRSCELLIAGFFYVVDLANMFQYRRNNPSRKRRIKRDRESAEKKGIAGLKLLPIPSQKNVAQQETVELDSCNRSTGKGSCESVQAQDDAVTHADDVADLSDSIDSVLQIDPSL